MPNRPQPAPPPDDHPVTPAKPAAPKPPADPAVYGTQWGAGGDGQKEPEPRPPDRPDKIKPPPEKN
jgi:hypothetical protein